MLAGALTSLSYVIIALIGAVSALLCLSALDQI